MNPIYQKISKLAHNEIYQFLKLDNQPLTDYNFQNYFNYIIQKNKIKVFEHHFENNLISGITMIDATGISLSIEKDNTQERKNFTKCHELGHFILKHRGTIFTENSNSRTQQEQEADYFASLILAPDIILATHLLYGKTYQNICHTLGTSNQALEVRLIHFLQQYSRLSYNDIKTTVNNFKTHKNNQIINITKTFKSKIITLYQKTKINPLTKFNYLIEKNNFITDKELKNLTDPTFTKTISQNQPHIKTWSYYDKGQTTFYAWNNNIITDKEAHQKAKTLHLLKTT